MKTPFGLLALHLGLAAIGPGMLTLPYALGNTGVVGGFLILLISYTASFYSTLVIFDAAAYVAKRDSTVPPPSYGYLVNQLLDRRWSLFLDLALVISGFGGAISFLIFLGDFVPPALQQSTFLSAHCPLLTERTPVILISSVLCTILSTTDNGVSHHLISSIPIIGFGWCLVTLYYRALVPATLHGPLALSEDLKILWRIPWSANGFPSLNLYLFAFLMQANVLPTFAAVSPLPPSNPEVLSQVDSPLLHLQLSHRLWEEESVPSPEIQLEDDVEDKLSELLHKTSLGRSRRYNRRLGTLRRRTLIGAALFSQSITMLYYVMLACLGVIVTLRHTNSIPQNFTRALPGDDEVYVWLRVVLILCLMILSPYLFSAVANGCMNLVAISLGRPMVAEGFGTFRKRLLYSTALVASSASVALRTDRVATVLSILGGWGATVLMCSFPAVMLYKVCSECNHFGLHDKFILTFCSAMSVIGFVATVLPYWMR